MRNSSTWGLACSVAVLLGLSALAGCGTNLTLPGQTAPRTDDAAITAAVKAKLAADGDINPFNIDVATNEGVVTLQGRVAREEGRTKAEVLARGVNGVKRVINLIKVGD